jgi:hypothetical protein
MSWIGRWFSRRRIYGEVSQEIREHLDEKSEELVAGGMSREEAAAAARREFGEDGRRVWRWLHVENLLMDIRYGLRTLRKNPGFTAAAVLTLALGIGANTALFSVIDAVLLRAPPFHDPGRLVAVNSVDLRHPSSTGEVSYPAFLDWRSRSHSFEAMSVWNTTSFTYTGGDQPESVAGVVVSANLFSTLGVSPAIGRGFVQEEDEPGRGQMPVVLSYEFWQSHFGGDPKVLGRALTLDSEKYSVVGVMPAQFQFPVRARRVELWTTVANDLTGKTPMAAQRGVAYLQVVARLKPGIGTPQAQADVQLCAPAWQTSQWNLNDTLKEGGRSGYEGRQGLRRGLVVVEFALALTLLTGAGLVIHSFWKLTRLDLGFRQDHVLTFALPVSFDRFSRPEQITNFYRQMLERISALPGILSATASSNTPIISTGYGGYGMDFQIAGQPAVDPSALPSAGFTMVTPDYFRTFGIAVMKGRSFTEQDVAGNLPVAMVNETFVKRHLSNLDPLKQRVLVRQLGQSTLGPPIEWNIVGVYHDVRNRSVRGESFSEIKVPLWQSPLPWEQISARTAGDPGTMTNSIAAEVRSVDPDLALDQVRTMDQVVDESLGGDRFVAWLFAGFAGVALLLAAIGIYGVMTFAVAQRTHEIGLRMALGAGSTEVLFMVLREGISLALVGLVLGLGGTYFVGRTMKSILYEVSAIDPVAVGAVVLVLLAAAVLACYLPARRATRVDAIVALRYE